MHGGIVEPMAMNSSDRDPPLTLFYPIIRVFQYAFRHNNSLSVQNIISKWNNKNGNSFGFSLDHYHTLHDLDDLRIRGL